MVGGGSHEEFSALKAQLSDAKHELKAKSIELEKST